MEGPKRNQKVLAPSYGLRCAQVPSLRSCSVGPPPRAIHGPSRLSRHPCRSTHSTELPLGLPGGQADQKHCTTRRPTGRPFGASVCYTISVVAAEERRLRSATKSSQKPGKALCLIHQVPRVFRTVFANCCVMGRSDGCARLVVAVCVVDRNARFVYVSAASKRILGYEPHELIGTPMIDLVFPADRERTLHASGLVHGTKPVGAGQLHRPLNNQA